MLTGDRLVNLFYDRENDNTRLFDRTFDLVTYDYDYVFFFSNKCNTKKYNVDRSSN